jgi:hypothetical protein
MLARVSWKWAAKQVSLSQNGLSPLWQVQSSCQQQLKRGDICEVHPWGSQKTKGSRKHELTTTLSGEQSSKCGTKWKLHAFADSPCQVEPTKTRTNYAGSRRTREQVNWLPTPCYNLERTRRAACDVTTAWLTFDMLLEFSFGTQMHWCRRAS